MAALRAAATVAQRSLEAARLRESTAVRAVHHAELAAARAEGQAFQFNFIQDQMFERNPCSFVWLPGDTFMLLILPSGENLMIQDQVSERIAYAPLFGFGRCQAEAYERKTLNRTW